MEIFLDMTIEYVTKAGINLLLAILLLVVGIKLSNWAIKLLQKGKGFSKLDVSLQSFLKSFLREFYRTHVNITMDYGTLNL